jgi:hypothetical protein
MWAMRRTGSVQLSWHGGRVNKFGVFYQNSSKFDGFSRNLKIVEILFIVSNFQKKIKISKKYVKKLDRILRLLVKKFL